MRRVNAELERKRRWLSSYAACELRCKALGEKIAEIKSNSNRMVSHLSHTPKGNPKPMDEQWIEIIERVDRLKDTLRDSVEECQRSMAQILEAIDELETEEERLIITYRYLLDKEWTEIEQELGYSSSKIFKLHRTALQNIQIPA